MLFRGTFIGAASGKVGSCVASHNKGGQYMRARVVPSGRVPSTYQSAVRNAIAGIATYWKTITKTQRDAWNTYALNIPGKNALGDAIQLSGENWYVACNVPRLQAGLARVDDAPVIYDRGDVAIGTATITAAGGTATLALTPALSTVAADKLLIYQGNQQSATRDKYYGSYRYAGSAAGTITNFVLTLPLPLSGAGNRTSFRLVMSRSDGRLSSAELISFPAA